MEPTSGLVIKGTMWLLGQFKTIVLERWSRHRAQAFFETFVTKYSESERLSQPLRDLEPVLEVLLKDETKSAILFDAYRRVCLSASSNIGPRVVAIMTARLVSQGRIATSDEERVLMAAETLSDHDFEALSLYLNDLPADNFEMELLSETSDSSWPQPSQIISLGPVNLGDFVGNWCLKLSNAGLVTHDIVQEVRDYDEDSEAGIDEPGKITTYRWKLRFQPEVVELKKIVDSLMNKCDITNESTRAAEAAA